MPTHIEPCLAGSPTSNEDQQLCKWYQNCARSVPVVDREPGDPIVLYGWFHTVEGDRCVNFIPKLAQVL